MIKKSRKVLRDDFVIIQVKTKGDSLSFVLTQELKLKYGLKEGDYLKIELGNEGFVCKKIKEVITDVLE